MSSQEAGNKPARDEKGRLLPGGTANPGGRPTLPDWFKEKGPEALKTLTEIAEGEREDPKMSQGQAALHVIERIYGKPRQAVELGGDELPKLLALLATGKLKVDDEGSGT